MKKVLIGCGIVVLLALVGLGYFVKQVWPNVKRVQAEWTAAFTELDALDAQHPFDPKAQTQLDAARFDQMLDVRLKLADYFTRVRDEMDAMTKDRADGGGPGWIQVVQRFIDQIATLMTEIAARLHEVAMGPTEFGWHTRLLWGALARVDAGFASTDLDVFKDEYTQFKERYEALRRQQEGLPPLEELLAELPPDALVTAGEVLAKDPAKVKRALAVTDVDHLYMHLPRRMEDVERVKPLQPSTSAPPPAAQPPIPAPGAVSEPAPVPETAPPEPAPAPR